MYAGWMTIAAMVLASGMWLAWEGVHAHEHGAAFARYRALYCVGALLAIAACALAAMGYVATGHLEDHRGGLIATLAFPAAVALGMGAMAVFQSATQLRRRITGNQPDPEHA